MFRRIDATNRGVLFTAPFALFALCAVGLGVYWLSGSTPHSWVLVITVIVSVIICGPFRIQVGRVPGLPPVGVAIIMLAIQPTNESPQYSVCIWAIGRVISELILRRNILQALYLAGVSTAAAFVFVGIHASLEARGVWSIVSFLAAAAAYYLIVLLVEFVRLRGRWALDHSFGLSALSPLRLGGVILLAGSSAALINFVDSTVIPWLEQDPEATRSPFVWVLSALFFYVLAQRARYDDIERRLGAVVEAAVELPGETEGGLAGALRRRVQSIVQASSVELRGRAPERHEIGAAVKLESGVEQFLIASRKLGGVPFAREDQHALATLAQMASQTARIQHEVNTLERRANSDPLTNLPNYGAFQLALVEANEHRPYHEGIALLFIDLDNFKKLNDSLGHHAGDELLRAVADRLQSTAGGGDFVARVGGDEFVVILTGLVSIEQAKEAADRIIRAISAPLALAGQDMVPVVSAGLAFSSHRELDAQTLVMDADRTMLQVKRSRRQGGSAEVSTFSIASHRSTRTNDIVARAINEDRLMLAFQPIVSLDEGKIWAFEALVRYVDPELGPITPPSLVARAKSLGLMNLLTKQVITKALNAAEEFYRLEPSITCMTVNLELRQISEDELGPFIREAARAHPNISLCIELNERSQRSVTDELRRDAEIMQAAGVMIALDDYGSDDSSVGALIRFPMDILKIDKSLIDNLEDQRQREVIKALQGFGDNLNYAMVVEGIETQEMVDVMVELGVRSAQGYFYGRPISLARTTDRLRRWGTQALAE
ncbi:MULTISPECIES: bifunctional diguanylate cyclase/phosphodiesterase [unclassified Leucobacter]|uniref:putative bifunctional diguanylate cyclase/phosphodiesterase n=1 Tax=unclassified Leucobacter TaxID=2621730 RepID=UPI00165D8654|nr:EAL domain-containing protein [Leucobacter sp. CX169]MBC9927822.1 EAL domain-containing protein [Leucobacter sp. cx-169]